MNRFHKNTEIVLNYTFECTGYSSRYWLSHSCFRQLGQYLQTNILEYSPEVSEVWLLKQEKSDSILCGYRNAIARLNDVYRTGHVCFVNRTKSCLNNASKDILNDYLTDVSSEYTDSHLCNIENRCRFFLCYVEMDRNVSSPGELTYDDILAFLNGPLTGLCKAVTCMYKGTVRKLLYWMHRQGKCTAGFAMILEQNHASKVLLLKDLPKEDVSSIIISQESSGNDNSLSQYLDDATEFRSILKEYGYANTMMTCAKTTLDLLFLFLDMNHLQYNQTTADIWFRNVSSFFGTNFHMSKRVLSLFEGYVRNGSVNPTNISLGRNLLYDSLPEWCRCVTDSFLSLKQRENKAPNTICMYRSCITRFCQFLNRKELTSFQQINAELLKEFNLTDMHKTAEGKNAYNVRIRKFLLYLADNGYVDNYFLGESLPCMSAPKCRIVQVFNEDDVQTLERHENPKNTAIGLRDRAILLLGMKMGLREIDVAQMRLDQIDWAGRSIRFVQEKTGVEMILPMPVEVGNAIFRYLREGRPDSSSPYIFITHKAPYKKICRSVCRGAVKRALGINKGSRVSFHDTRRTYATGRFRNNCGTSLVADLLGHTSTDTVHKYISLDEERMRLCPIRLSEAGIHLEGGFRNE